MLSVNINRDIEQYQETVLLGLNARQTVGALITLLGGVGMICLCHYVMGISMQLSVYTAMPVCILLFLPALKTKEGMPVTEVIKQSSRKKKKLLYKTAGAGKQSTANQQQKDREGKKDGKRSFAKKKVQIPTHKK